MTTPPQFDQDFLEGFENLLRWRRDVREFTHQPVTDDMLQSCLELANLAPSVGLSQPWRFVEVKSDKARACVISSFEQCNKQALASYEGERAQLYARLKLEGLRQAPCQMAVFCDTQTTQGHGLGRATMPETLHYSTVMAIHTFWLSARAKGLGVGWVSILDPDAVARACAAPAAWQLVGYLCIGWPEVENETPKLQLDGWETRQEIQLK